MSLFEWMVVAALVLLAVTTAFLGLFWRRKRDKWFIGRARRLFRQQRERLEARFVTLASQSGTPRGLRWSDCEFDDGFALVRDRGSGQLRALVGITVCFEAVEGGAMEDAPTVGAPRSATAVFHCSGGQWTTEGRAVFNLTPAQTIRRFRRELKTVD